MPAPRKIDVVKTEKVSGAVPMTVFGPLKEEIDARNKRLGDSADADYFVPYMCEQLTEELRKERLQWEKEQRDAKDAKDKPNSGPRLQPVQQSA